MSEPRWVGRAVALAIHADQLAQHGGLAGVRDEGGPESALNRAPTRLHYQPETDLNELAAAYGFAIATTHPFIDGNKRTAFMCTYVFLGLNGLRIAAAEPEVVELMLAVAAGSMNEAGLAEWLEAHTALR